MGKEQKKIKGIEQLLAMAGTNLNILEEEVDIKVQKEYFSLAHKISQNSHTYSKIKKEYLEHINDLFNEETDIDVKKRMLVVLADRKSVV